LKQISFLELHLGHLVFKSWRVACNNWTGLWTGLLDWTDGLDYWINISAEFGHITCRLANQSKWKSHIFVVASTMAYYTMSAVTIIWLPHLTSKIQTHEHVLKSGEFLHGFVRRKVWPWPV